MDNFDKANELNQCFADIGFNLAELIPEAQIEADYTFDGGRIFFHFEPVRREEVLKSFNGGTTQ